MPNITKTLGGPDGWDTPFIIQDTGSIPTTLRLSFYRFGDGGLVAQRVIGGLMPGRPHADVPRQDSDLARDTQYAVVVESFGAPIVSVVNDRRLRQQIPGHVVQRCVRRRDNSVPPQRDTPVLRL
jgi:hypothetical protein